MGTDNLWGFRSWAGTGQYHAECVGRAPESLCLPLAMTSQLVALRMRKAAGTGVFVFSCQGKWLMICVLAMRVMVLAGMLWFGQLGGLSMFGNLKGLPATVAAASEMAMVMCVSCIFTDTMLTM